MALLSSAINKVQQSVVYTSYKMTRLSIPLSAKPGKHRIAVATVDLQQTTSLESATTSLTRQY